MNTTHGFCGSAKVIGIQRSVIDSKLTRYRIPNTCNLSTRMILQSTVIFNNGRTSDFQVSQNGMQMTLIFMMTADISRNFICEDLLDLRHQCSINSVYGNLTGTPQ